MAIFTTDIHAAHSISGACISATRILGKGWVKRKYIAAPVILALLTLTPAAAYAQDAPQASPPSPRERLTDFIRKQDISQPTTAYTPPLAPIINAPRPIEAPEAPAPILPPSIVPNPAPISVASTPATLPLPETPQLAGAEPSLSDPGIQALRIPQEKDLAELNSEIVSTNPSPSSSAAADIITVNPQRGGLSPSEREDSIVRDFTSSSAALDGRDRPKSFGFFTHAKRYIAQRGQGSRPRLTLRYKVTSKNARTAAPGPSASLDIILGEDYAAITKKAGETQIYDFKTQRILTVSQADGSFTNASLFAAAYQNIETVNRMTAKGTKRSLDLGGGHSLDSFFLESALGYSAAPLGGALNVSQSSEKISASFNAKPVFSAALNGPKLEDEGMAYSFIGLLHHSEPVHPAILAELKDLRAAPNAMTFHSYGPKHPDGKIISWTLMSKISETAPFPLKASASSIIEQKNVSPLGYVISEAIAGRALGGAPNPRQMLTAINLRLKAKDPLSAWVSAQSLKDRVGGCDQIAGLCTAISKAQARSGENAELARLINAFKGLDSKVTRLGALIELKPSADALDAPSLVLRKMAVNLSRTSKAELKAAGLDNMDPAQLLRQAIARNPYDPLAYQGLARIHAARGEFVQSWDMNDALRAFPDIPTALTAPIERAESKLKTRAPGYFPPVGG